MSIRTCQRCDGRTKAGTQCKRRTCRTNLCFQHLKSMQGLQLKKSNIPNAGLGLFATKPFRNNDKIAEYTGDVSAVPIQGDYVYKASNTTFIDAKRTNTAAGRFGNACRAVDRPHCSGNNAKIVYDRARHNAAVKATKTIRPNQEIYVSYGPAYFRA